MAERLKLTNQKFGKLTALRISHTAKDGSYHWECSCECGGTIITRGAGLKAGHTKSCGCTKGGPDAAFRVFYKRYQQGAAGRNFDWDLTESEFRRIMQEPCHYCGQLAAEKKISSYGHVLVTNGIDRVDNAIGYTINNVVSCCSPCNKLKATFKVDEFIGRIKKIHSHLKL